MDKILLLQSIPGFGLVKIKKFLNENRTFIDDDDYFNYLILLETGFSVERYKENVDRVKDSCFKLGISIITGDNLKIDNSPLLLYLKGDKNLLIENKILSVVGTREPTKMGIILGTRYVKYAVNRGWITISGLAKGCDHIAHKATVCNYGKTIAVIPMGYREGLTPWITEHGLIISEYPPNTRIEKFRCVNRNRIITGLSKGLFVIESNRGSGSEHSMRFALKENLPISYCVGYPGIEKYSQIKITDREDFDLFLNICTDVS